MLHGHGPAQLPGWVAKYRATWLQFIVTFSNLPLLILWQTWQSAAKTGSVIAKKPKLIATQTNIAASAFLNSVE